MRRLPRLALVLVLAGACSKASDEGQAKQWQEAPPPKSVSIPTGLSIAVQVDGADAPPITSESLAKATPDFHDEERRAWRVATLVSAAGAPGAIVEAATPSGVAVKFTQPSPEGVEPVLFLTRRGEVIVAALDPKDPFPRYHGQGARMRRPGDSMPRVAPVARLSVTTPR